MSVCVFMTGATGYLGRHLAPVLLARGHAVRGLVRRGSEPKLAAGVVPVVANALDHQTFQDQVKPATTFVHLLGVPHPSPAKARQFREIDLVSVRESILAATHAGIQHFVYVSVAQPSPIMRAYVEVRVACEAMIRETGIPATVLRPLYVLGPGHRWPYALLPMYWILERLPISAEGAQRLGLVTLSQMIAALVEGIEHRPTRTTVVTVPEIRRASGTPGLPGRVAR
jgi:uncharacterized protein YbjT (DUF2867 family)